MYNAALEHAGYTEKVNYDSKINENKLSRNRKRKFIWYNPPCDKCVYTIIGRVFLSLLDKYFLKEHKLNKIFTQNIVKLSYSCTTNIKYIIKKNTIGKSLKGALRKTQKRRVIVKRKTDVH